MTYARTPGIPRARLRSHADDEPIPERVYEVLKGFDDRIGGLESASQKNEIDNAKILKEVRDLGATDRHATTKLIQAAVLTVVTTVGGVVGTIVAMRPGQAPPPVARSQLDIKLDVCRAIHEPGSKAECMSRVFEAEPK